MTAPTTIEECARLRLLTKQELVAMGLRQWGRQETHDGDVYGPVLWLYPQKWYGSLPDGLPIVDINFQNETFQRGVTDDDHRFGMLSFGFLRDINEALGETS